ncbi:redoxin domain-containing protein [Hymenobacter busanensis]|uniref:Redoxin domain-containing protein n=1 Tax=Hymenobacter busanensis TaxID=2607656 RepID=A0A7L5A0A7_9BACT|nr:redoxin domain-containing protein [Hymenobacter busanensis]KAA9338355.1 redoxin domain-containing protein [Hymenobacter busanensis]QHJ09219.1 redoxin domain-containing protein [Hymenobacter busanensis]
MSLRRLSLLAAALLITATVVVTSARAQSGPVSDFTLKSADNTAVSLSSFAEKKGVVVVFTNPSCPFSKLYESRLLALASQYEGQGVQFLFVNAPINLEQAPEAAGADKVKVKTTGASLGQYSDEGLKAATLLGVTKTPEAVVLQPTGNGFTMRYRGAIDDNPQMESYVKDRYLKAALDAVVAGQAGGLTEKRASGCLIKK